MQLLVDIIVWSLSAIFAQIKWRLWRERSGFFFDALSSLRPWLKRRQSSESLQPSLGRGEGEGLPRRSRRKGRSGWSYAMPRRLVPSANTQRSLSLSLSHALLADRFTASPSAFLLLLLHPDTILDVLRRNIPPYRRIARFSFALRR